MVSLLPNGFTGGLAMTVRSIRDVAAAVRGRRQDLGLNQAELAKRAAVSRKWIYEFEAGKATAELGLVMRVLDALGFQLELRLGSQAKGSKRSHDTVDLDAVLNQLREIDEEAGRR
jgi:HTH-type transcriptional regulator / antitoxin HipB